MVPSPSQPQLRASVLTLTLTGRQLTFAFEDGDRIEIGRGEGCAVLLDDRFASRRHCEVERVAGQGFVLRDLASANGTRLNGRTVSRALLASGDMIEIGGEELRVRLEVSEVQTRGCLDCGAAVAPGAGGQAALARCPACAPATGTPPAGGLVQALAEEGFTVLAELPSRGVARLFRARRAEFGPVLVLKVLDLRAAVSSKQIARFVEGARAQASLRHRNVASVVDLRHRRQLVLLAMEDVAGETLQAKLLRGRRPMAVKESLRIAYQIARALDHMAGRHIVHRDLRPTNIMITPDGDAKLIDFGLAKPIGSDEDSQPTDFGEPLGTPGYMAPEQIHVACYADARADIYGLGATLYHCLSGRAVQPGRSDHRATLSPLSEVPRDVVQLVIRLVQPNPAQRLQTPAAVLQHIEAVTTELTGVAAHAGNTELLLRLTDEQSSMLLTPVRPSPRPTATFQGRIQDMALIEFLQMLEFNGKSGTLTLGAGTWTANLRIAAGTIVSAEAGSVSGRAVLERVLDLEGGTFSFDPHPVPAPCDAARGVKIGQLLLDHLRRTDEIGRP